MTVLSLFCVFYNLINPFLIKTFANKFKIVSNKNNLLVHFVDVGQGDAVAINLPDGKVMLIDAGDEDVNVTYTKYLTENVFNTSKDKTVDYLVLTHADVDHIGGTLRLLKNFKIKKIFMPKIDSNSNIYQEILKLVENKYNYQILDDEYLINQNGYAITFLESLSSANTNDSSQVIKLEYKNKSFLFTGDISHTVENDYVKEYGEFLNVDVLKVSHHGSKESSSEEFLNITSPQYSVISCGKDNSYGHPHEETMLRLRTVNSNIIRTDESGNILFLVGNNYNLKCLTGDYYITPLSLNYTNLIVVIEFVLIITFVVIIIKKEKVNKYINN